MAKRSPPTPFETGSINPSVAFTAVAASTALPPRFKMSIPTCVAAGTLVQTIPWRATTSDRVAKFFPVMRSIWADELPRNANKATKRKRTRIDVIESKLTTAAVLGESRECVRRCPRYYERNRSLVRQTLCNVDSHPYRARADGFHYGARSRGRAVAQRHNQKDFFDTDPHAQAAKEEKFFGHKKAIAFADPFAKKEIIASDRTRIARAISHSVD